MGSRGLEADWVAWDVRLAIALRKRTVMVVKEGDDMARRGTHTSAYCLFYYREVTSSTAQKDIPGITLMRPSLLNDSFL